MELHVEDSPQPAGVLPPTHTGRSIELGNITAEDYYYGIISSNVHYEGGIILYRHLYRIY